MRPLNFAFGSPWKNSTNFPKVQHIVERLNIDFLDRAKLTWDCFLDKPFPSHSHSKASTPYSSASISSHVTISAACVVGSLWRFDRRLPSLSLTSFSSLLCAGSKMRTLFGDGGGGSYISKSSWIGDDKQCCRGVLALWTKALRRTNPTPGGLWPFGFWAGGLEFIT